MRRRFLFVVVGWALSAAPLLCQQLSIQTEAGKKTVLSKADLEALPHTSVTTDGSGIAARFEGVTIKAVLERAGVSLGESMRGKRLASCLLVEAADGYRVVFALAEIDPAFTDRQIVLAFQKNGKPLDEKEGPYRIVAPEEKRMARWIRQVTAMKIVDVQ